MKVIESNLKKVREIGFRELRLDADSVILGVKNGESYIVKRNSRPLFRIVPLEEEVWETVIDFTEVAPEGVEIDTVLSAMDELKQENPRRYGRQSKKVSVAA
jgi:antitoxin (DNA-binding transcriptional repressor) of toxin-antitoxin stability system